MSLPPIDENVKKNEHDVPESEAPKASIVDIPKLDHNAPQTGTTGEVLFEVPKVEIHPANDPMEEELIERKQNKKKRKSILGKFTDVSMVFFIFITVVDQENIVINPVIMNPNNDQPIPNHTHHTPPK